MLCPLLRHMPQFHKMRPTLPARNCSPDLALVCLRVVHGFVSETGVCKMRPGELDDIVRGSSVETVWTCLLSCFIGHMPTIWGSDNFL